MTKEEEIKAALRSWQSTKRSMAAHEEALDTARANERKAFSEYVMVKWGVGPGVKVKHKGETFVVDSIRSTSFEREDRKPWLQARRIKVDGTPGKVANCIYDEWDVL